MEGISGDPVVQELLCRAQQGDAGAMDALITKYQPLLASLARRFREHLNGHPAIDRDDLRQEGARQFVELAQEYAAERGVSFGVYLKNKLAWRMSNYLRAERRRTSQNRPLDGAPLDHLCEEFRTAVHAGIENPRLRSALRRLSPKQRGVISRIYWQEKTVAEIARADGISPQAVTALRRRAETSIREEIAGDGGFTAEPQSTQSSQREKK